MTNRITVISALVMLCVGAMVNIRSTGVGPLDTPGSVC